MFIPFNEISENSRTWIFASEKELNEVQLNEITLTLKTFTENWQSHNQNVHSTFQIIEKRFIVIAADGDKSDISGCGIDKSMHVMLELEQKLKLSLTNKSLLFFKQKQETISIPLLSMKQAVLSNELSPDTLYYNTLASTIEEVKKSFCIPAQYTWLKKYFVFQTN
ncbi:MAG: hypothetical protein H7329_06630 [Opitutaceae bacterium]|nr:hypothetical protein [Cytophagales bacterium]